jgi:hypothetical protein
MFRSAFLDITSDSNSSSFTFLATRRRIWPLPLSEIHTNALDREGAWKKRKCIALVTPGVRRDAGIAITLELKGVPAIQILNR